MADLIPESHEEPAEKRNIIGTVLIAAFVVFMLTLGVVIVLALMEPHVGIGIYSNVMINL